jgi:hypothetical protein
MSAIANSKEWFADDFNPHVVDVDWLAEDDRTRPALVAPTRRQAPPSRLTRGAHRLSITHNSGPLGSAAPMGKS